MTMIKRQRQGGVFFLIVVVVTMLSTIVATGLVALHDGPDKVTWAPTEDDITPEDIAMLDAVGKPTRLEQIKRDHTRHRNGSK